MPSSASNSGTSEDTKTIVTVLLLVFIYPVGIIVMWAWTSWPKWLKWLLTALLIVFLVLPILAVIALVAINPAKQFQQANDTKRQADVSTIANAYIQFEEASMSGPSPLLPSAPPQPTEISSSGFDICTDLISNKYLTALPSDPTSGTDGTTTGANITNCNTTYDTGYTISVDSNGAVTVSAPKTQLGQTISVTKTLPQTTPQ